MRLVRALGAVVGILLVLGVLAVVTHDGDDDAPAQGARMRLDGSAVVERPDGSTDELDSGDSVRTGDVVLVDDGSAIFDVAGGATLEGRAGTQLRIGAVPELLAGDLLVIGPDGTQVEAAGTVVTLRARGDDDAAARLRRTLSVTAAVYTGGADIDSGGQSRTIPALRQLVIATFGRPPATPDPLGYDATDPWDLRFLGEAIALTDRLDALSRSYTARAALRPAPTTAATLEALVPGLVHEPAFGDGLLATVPADAGEVLVGVAIVVLGDGGTFEERWTEVFEFRGDGAAWGLVALDQGVTTGPLVGEVEAAIGRAAEPGREPPRRRPPDERASPPPTPGTTDPTEPTVPGPGPTTPPPAPPGDPEPGDSPTLPPHPPRGDLLPDTGIPLIDDLVEPIDDLLAGLLDLPPRPKGLTALVGG